MADILLFISAQFQITLKYYCLSFGTVPLYFENEMKCKSHCQKNKCQLSETAAKNRWPINIFAPKPIFYFFYYLKNLISLKSLDLKKNYQIQTWIFSPKIRLKLFCVLTQSRLDSLSLMNRRQDFLMFLNFLKASVTKRRKSNAW